MEEEEAIMLPENMFINLLDTNLQERILNGKELDIDVKNTMETLLQEGPTCYELFSSLTCAYHACTSSFPFMIDMHFTTG